jgi:hypothetical protein
LACPFHNLTNKENFIWSPDAKHHFDKLNQGLFSTPILFFPYLVQPFEIELNASQFFIGVVLKQGGHPIAYHSKTLSTANLN